MRFKIYKSSGLATFVSIVGAFTCYAGILCLFEKEFLGAVICIAAGFAIQIAAGEIAEKAALKKQKKQASSVTPVSVQPGKTAADSRCAACGNVIAADAAFCTHCGGKVQRAGTCLRCGSKLVDGARFCGECGYQN